MCPTMPPLFLLRNGLTSLTRSPFRDIQASHKASVAADVHLLYICSESVASGFSGSVSCKEDQIASPFVGLTVFIRILIIPSAGC